MTKRQIKTIMHRPDGDISVEEAVELHRALGKMTIEELRTLCEDIFHGNTLAAFEGGLGLAERSRNAGWEFPAVMFASGWPPEE